MAKPLRPSALLTIIALSCIFEAGCNFLYPNSTQNSNPAATLSISGTITNTAGASGTTVTLSGPAGATMVTDSSGHYTFSGLARGTYKVTPSKSGFTFSPASHSMTLDESDMSGVNFSSSKKDSGNTLSISGLISPASNGANAAVTLSGTESATTTADASGRYTFSGLASGSYRVTPAKNGYSFSPASQNTTLASADATSLNFSVSKEAEDTWSISGTISPSNNGNAATVTLSGAFNGTTTTDSSGRYTFSGLSSGNYKVTPSKNGYSFSPSSQNTTITSANQSAVNFTASKNSSSNTFSISGSISPTANGSGTVVSLSGTAGGTTTADSSGHYSFTGLPSGTYTVTPSKAEFSFSPSHQNTTVTSSDVEGINFSAAANSVSGTDIYPGQDIPSIVNNSPAGTTFVIHPGTYRLTHPIIPKTGDSFIGQAACAPPTTPCQAVISGAAVIGPQATFDGKNYKVTGQAQQNQRALTDVCDSGWSGCIYPEDLFFDGVPLKHLNSSTLPSIGPGQWWFDYANHTIYFHDNPSGHTVETSVVNNAFGGPANNVTIKYLTVEAFADMYPNGAIGAFQNSNTLTQGVSWTVANCEAKLNHGYGVRAGYRTQVLNSYIHDNGQEGIGGGIATSSNPSSESINSGILIQGNTINHNNFAHFNPGFEGGGFKIGATSGVVLRGNTIQHNEGAGIHFDISSQNELVDGNVITDNSDADGLVQELGYGNSTFRNNVVLRNGAQLNGNNYVYQIAVRASSGVHAYCNVMEIPNGNGINGWGITASNRGSSPYPPYQYLASTDNSFHHNTVIWDSGSGGVVGFSQNDPANQPNFFTNNTPPDYNTYHLASSASPRFVYDNNDSHSNQLKTFSIYQATNADMHGSVDANYSSGFPSVAITSPSDQATVGNPISVSASASDASGISKVEFYVDWTLQGTATSSPYNFNWNNGSAGTHTLAAMAYSNAGIKACYAVTVTRQ